MVSELTAPLHAERRERSRATRVDRFEVGDALPSNLHAVSVEHRIRDVIRVGRPSIF